MHNPSLLAKAYLANQYAQAASVPQQLQAVPLCRLGIRELLATLARGLLSATKKQDDID